MQLDKSPVLISYSIDSTLLGNTLFTAAVYFCVAYHTFLTRQ